MRRILRAAAANLGVVAFSVMFLAPPGGGAEPAGVDHLKPVRELPDPFLMNDGTRVGTKADWARRRKEIKAMLLHYSYGHMPPAPKNLAAKETSSEAACGGAAVRKRIVLTMGPGRKVKLRLEMIVPKGPGPFPVIIKNTHTLDTVPITGEIVKRGYAVSEYIRTDLDDDKPDSVGLAQAAWPDCDWATLAVWAWGTHRVVDYVMTLDNIDKARIIVTGHSRGGKTAMLAGALDERVALTAPNSSGAGGTGCYRVLGQRAQSLEHITRKFPHWFHGRFRSFANKEALLPFDLHFLKALVAPRALLNTHSRDDLHANPMGTQVTHTGAVPVFEWLGAREKIGIHYRRGGHAQAEEDWRALLDFADKVLFGKKVTRRFDSLPFAVTGKAFSWTAPAKVP